MMPPPPPSATRPARVRATIAGLTVIALMASGCSSHAADSDAGREDARSSEAGAGLSAPAVENCGYELELEAPPERVVLLETAPVTILDGLGLLDRVVARAGDFNPGYYEEDLAAQVSQIDSLTDDVDASGHLAISQEQVIAQDPDLVLGQPDGVTRAGLAAAGAELLVQELYCAESSDDSPDAAAASFETLYTEIETYGQLFDRRDTAEELTERLRARVAEVSEEAPGEGRSAAVLYPTAGAGADYAYGQASMAHPQLEAAGFENVFGDVSERVFEVQPEELLTRDPDVIILLYQEQQDGIQDLIGQMPGAESLTAVRHDAVYAHLFNFTEPASPLSVDGLEMIANFAEESS